MRKELVISSIPQETRVAVVEDGELVEFLIERRRSQGIAGNIYKGRVTKVLPGMQSAFVDIGLERDAFLYVSDFLEDTDEYERIVASAEDEALKEGTARRDGRGTARSSDRERDRSRGRERKTRDRAEDGERDGGPEAEVKAQPERESSGTDRAEGDSAPSPEGRSGGRKDDRGRDVEGERRAPRSGDRKDRRSKIPSFESRSKSEAPDAPAPRPPVSKERSVLPGESLAKYRRRPARAKSSAPEAPALEVESEDTEPAAAREVTAKPEVQKEAESVADTSSDGAAAVVNKEPADAAGTEEPAAHGSPSEEAAESGASAVESAESGEAAPGGEKSKDSLIEGETRRARIIDRGSDGAFTRKAPSRRPRRRSSGRPDGDTSDSPSKAPTISDLLKAGQEILVQVSKEPLGKKGARITSHIALPGRYLVYMPTVDHVGVSRKIASDEERARLRKIIAENRQDLPGGFIVRTAAAGRDEKEFIQDLHFLFKLWKEIREKNESTSAPAVIHSDLGLVERVLRDQLSDDYEAIRLDSEVEYTKVLDFVSKFQPSLVNRVKLHLKNSPIFEEYGLQQEIDQAMRSKVWLKSGGYIVVNQTEALVAIDVNTGKFVGKSNRLEDTIVKTNLDAVHEIVRQIRLRNLGGIIVVDFIDMEERKNRQRVMQALEEELDKDRSPSKILQFNDFGLVAITRKRTQASLERVLGTACPRCLGSGYVKAIETVCYEIQQELKKMLDDIEGDEVTIRVSPEVAKALKSAEFVDFTELEEELRKDIRIQSDPMLPAERFDVYE